MELNNAYIYNEDPASIEEDVLGKGLLPLLLQLEKAVIIIKEMTIKNLGIMWQK